MIEEKFAGLLTMDKNIYTQQNVSESDVFIITIKARDNKIGTLQDAIPKITQLLTSKLKGIFEVVIKNKILNRDPRNVAT